MSRRIRLRAAIIAVALSLVVSWERNVNAQVDDQSNGLWFVELDDSIDTFRASVRAAGLDVTERYVYQRVWRGVSVRTTADASTLAALRGVRAIFPVLTVARGPVEPSLPELAHALTMTGADVAQNTLGLTGAGVKVGVIDTGIDYDHPDLGGGFGPGFRVTTGYDFVGDRYDAAGRGGALIAHPDRDPDDCNGHGTHVAGIVGASGNPDAGGARGVAPGVTFGAYRVFGCEGSTAGDIMLAAMERALADGMDVVNMSIGAAFQTWPQYPTAVGADALVDAGVVVVISIGNAGANGVYSASAPGVGRKVIGVASFDNSHVEQATFSVSPDDRVFGYNPAAGAPAPPTSGTFVLARTGTPTSTTDACSVLQPNGTLVSPLPPGSLTGKVALIRRGTCSFYEKSTNAQNAGAAAVVIYNNAAGLLFLTVAPPSAAAPPVAIPVVGIQAADGVTINNRIAAGETTLTWSDERAFFPNPTGGLISSFSSYGLTAELGLKPNIGAPGGLIRSTVPIEQGRYAFISGTSMASPHVAGAAALYLQAHPPATSEGIKTALQNSADPAPFSTTPFRDAAHRQGAGMVDIDDAILATTAITPSEVAVGEGTTAQTFTFTITNSGPAAVTYMLSHVSGITTFGSTFAPSLASNAASVLFTPSSVNVPAGGSATFDATINPAGLAAIPVLNRGVYGGSIVATGGGATYRVPYAGFIGDYQTIQVLAPGGCALSPFPGIFKIGGTTLCAAATPTAVAVTLDVPVTRQPDGAVFLVENREDRPVILFHLAHQSRRIEIRAVEQATGRSYLVAFADYLIRNATNGVSLANGGFSTFTWDGKQLFTNAAGKVHRKEVPEGAYKLQLVVTKALAEAGNPSHTEVWTSPTIIIER
jgi:minor extracellular serine protease Vpr